MDILRYKQAKARNTVELKRYGQQFQLFARQFDSSTGEELPPIIGTLDMQQVNIQRDLCAQNLAALDELLTDMQNLTV